MSKDKIERNYVADAYNWEKRIKGENESARIWSSNWGELYAKGQPQLYDDKIKQIEQEIKDVPVKRIVTNSQMSYKNVKAYTEWGPNFKRRTFGKFDDFMDDERKDDLICNEDWDTKIQTGRRRKRGCLQ